MKIGSILTFFSLILSFTLCRAQYDDKKVLMTVDGRDVESGEFVRMYNKSIDPSSKTDINEYLGQFIAFKLKVAEAIKEGYDTTRAYRDELNGYRNQLAQSYLTDPDIKEKLLKKAFERYPWEVNASHLLISCSSDASPEDTLKAYKKAIEARDLILGGEPFDKVAKAYSDDRSVQLNGGNLGYFTVFQMIAPFEDYAFSTPPGSVSMPVRTSFGYHIIKVTDKRPSVGKVRIAHIMKAAPPGSDEKQIKNSESEIKEIYSKLKNGESFSKLARQFSDHKESAVNGGVMNWFGTGEIISDFSETAFALKDTGDYTLPFRTPYGFHIIKLLEKKPQDSWEEARPTLEAKLARTNLTAIGKKAFVDRLRKEYSYNVDNKILDWFVKNTDSLIMIGRASFNVNQLPEGNIFSFAGHSVPAGDFAGYLEKRGNLVLTKNPGYFVNSSLESFSSDEIMKYENSVLETKYPDFRYLMAEFHDGILLFDISSAKIWDKVQDDTAGLHTFYDSNKNKFLSQKSVEGKLYTLKDPKGDKRLGSAFRKYYGKPGADENIEKTFNSNNDTVLYVTEGKWFAGENRDIDSIPWTIGIHKFTKDGLPSVLEIKNVKEPVPLPFKEALPDVISGYQDWLTEKWIKELKLKYVVKIDQNVFEEVKMKLENE